MYSTTSLHRLLNLHTNSYKSSKLYGGGHISLHLLVDLIHLFTSLPHDEFYHITKASLKPTHQHIQINKTLRQDQVTFHLLHILIHLIYLIITLPHYVFSRINKPSLIPTHQHGNQQKSRVRPRNISLTRLVPLLNFLIHSSLITSRSSKNFWTRR